MQTKRRALKWFVWVTTLLILQSATFYTVGPSLLRDELLPDYFLMRHERDSAYIRDFYVTKLDFPVFTPLSHHLENYPDDLKKKLKVGFIYFDQPQAPKAPSNNFSYIVYNTWMERATWITMSNFFKLYQVEFLTINGERHSRRHVTYQWCLFFWIKTFEFIESTDELDYEPILK